MFFLYEQNFELILFLKVLYLIYTKSLIIRYNNPKSIIKLLYQLLFCLTIYSIYYFLKKH